ncbi:unnamed protein product, partial [Mesorhabditis spiculigera]
MSAEEPKIAPAGAEIADENASTDLTILIQGVLQQTQDRFQHMSDQIIRRIDDMTKRIDDLEKNITDLMTQNQIDPPQI